jgi:hypothetical protein
MGCSRFIDRRLMLLAMGFEIVDEVNAALEEIGKRENMRV